MKKQEEDQEANESIKQVIRKTRIKLVDRYSLSCRLIQKMKEKRQNNLGSFIFSGKSRSHISGERWKVFPFGPTIIILQFDELLFAPVRPSKLRKPPFLVFRFPSIRRLILTVQLTTNLFFSPSFFSTQHTFVFSCLFLSKFKTTTLNKFLILIFVCGSNSFFLLLLLLF